MKYDVTFYIHYTIDDAVDEWDAIKQAEEIFDYDTSFNYDVDANPINDEEEE